ncbi:ANM_HP_G0211600.mRNA.1.CDS.1 [Saccharomyces cerevisiae]|nr:ANM_HP_G0211600.mRNA.1.CDS.1 [Saccharomyces cerevisiae]CAI6971436.1 ANM_HP_G0211600.mRNA.1.CDS.1 [Saccharomyces cerevisiae]
MTALEPRDGEEYTWSRYQPGISEVITVLVNNLASSEAEIQLLYCTDLWVILSISPNVFILFQKFFLCFLKLLSDLDPHITEIAQLW